MTCIVGCVEGNRAYIGADSGAVRGYIQRALKEPKVFQVGPFVIGYTSSFRMGQILQYNLAVPDQPTGHCTKKYMVCDFIGAVRCCLKRHGYLKSENSREEIGTFMVSYRGGLYRIGSDLQVLESLDGLAACGSGEEFALGAMLALQGLSAVKRMCRALEIAAYFDINVTGPFDIKSTLA